MKRIILGALGATAFLAGMAPVALADTNGYIDGAWAFEDGDSSSYDGYRSLGGAFSGDIATNWTATLSGHSLDHDHGDHSHQYNHVTVGAAYNGGTFAIGAHGGFFDLDGSNFDGLGIDGALNFSQFQLTGSFDQLSDASSSDDDISVWRIGGAFFINDNLAVGADFAGYDDDGSTDDPSSWSVDAEYQLASLPLSFTAAYISVDDGSSDNVNAFQLGVRLSFGTNVVERRHGAGMFTSAEQITSDATLGNF